ncbi:MAG: DUF4825 domain-containing protein [Lachnospiraceae bacterium]|nr:DUF4825 domain-containing protein [Lachnospiraceae bacterium]
MKEIIITSSVLTLCIMLIRIIFKGKISGRLQYALWLLVALRLIIPSSAQIYMAIGSIEEFRIMDLVEALEERFGDVTEQLEKPAQFTMSLNNPIAGQAAEFMLGEDLDIPTSADGPTSVFVAGRIGLSWLDILRGIWIGGVVTVALWMIITNIIFFRRLHKGRKEFALPKELESICYRKSSEKGCYARAGKAGKIKFYTTDYLTSSCLYGMPGREAVYLTPDIVQDQSKLRHVVTHELCHRKHGDSFWSLLRSILLCVYWINPLVWVAAVLSKRDCELACDEEALLILGEEERIPYGETLLSIITGKSKLSDIACTATTMNGSGKSVKERIKFIADKPKVLGVAVVAVLIFVMLVSVAAFTKNPLFNGKTWEGEITLTVGDMRIDLPETIAGISGYDTAEEGNSVIIYQVASGKEAGRFSVLSYEEALSLLDEGREIVPFGDYGMNPSLKSYMYSSLGYRPTGLTTHIYRPDTTEEESTESGSENPMLDKDWDVVALDEAIEGQTEGIIAHEDMFYTEEMDNVDGIPGTDINDETTYIIDDSSNAAYAEEESIDYLPNEEITVTYTPSESESVTEHYYSSADSSDKCYVYVKADYSNVKEKNIEEMEYINSELESVAGRVVVVSINRAIRDEIFSLLAQNRTEYLGDASKTGALVSALPQTDGLQYRSIALHTLETEPETALSLDVRYEMTTQNMTDADADILFFNAAMLFATIRNLDECNFILDQSETATDYRADYLDDGNEMEIVDEYIKVTYNRADLEEAVGITWSDEAHKSDESYIQWLEDLYVRIAAYLP